MMKENVVRGTQFVEEKISNLGRDASRVKGVVADAVEDSMISAKRAVRRGYGAAEDLLYDTSHRIRRYPLRSVACAFACGALVGWLLFRNRRS